MAERAIVRRILIIGKRLIAGAVLISFVSVAHAEAPHSFQIVNNSGLTVVIAQSSQSYCIDSVSWPGPIGTGQSATVNWEDRNSGGAYACGDEPKFVAFTVSFSNNVGTPWAGYIGMIHNEFRGKWYNALFWANNLRVWGGDGPTWDGAVDTTTGPSPPDWIVPGCPYGACAIGPFHEMYYDDKDSYNWPLYHEYEPGWSFQINAPTTTVNTPQGPGAGCLIGQQC